VVPETGSQLDPSIRVGQSLADWSGGQWRVVHALGCSVATIVRARTLSNRARRMVRLAAQPALAPARHRIALRSLRSVVRDELAMEDADVIVTNAHRAADGRFGGSLAELIGASGRPVLAVKDMFGDQPRRIAIVTEPQDIDRDVLRASITWMLSLLGPDPGAQSALPVELDLVHAAMSGLDWSVARFRFTQQTEDGFGHPHVVVRSACPELPPQIPELLNWMKPDLVVVFQDRRGWMQGHHPGRLARRIIQRSTCPVLLLPPAPLSEHCARDHDSIQLDCRTQAPAFQPQLRPIQS
jgi:nucleotide-binding universal stress UspA family protein